MDPIATVVPFHADLHTPVSAYLKLRHQDPWSFLLESVEGSERWSRYSVIGIGAQRILTLQNGVLSQETPGSPDAKSQVQIQDDDLVEHLRKAASSTPALPDACPDAIARFVGGLFGFVAYDALRFFEPKAKILSGSEPDLIFIEPKVLAIFDNQDHALHLVGKQEADVSQAIARLKEPMPPYIPPKPWVEPTADDPSDVFEDKVQRIKEYIAAGDIFQAVLSRRFSMPAIADPFHVYRGLRGINPSPYLYFFQTPTLSLAGASPEVMVRIQNQEITLRPIAGTRHRGETTVQDIQLEKDLLADPKERSEHIMLVDLGRNDVGRVAQASSINVPEFMVVERYSHVMHLVTEVRGTLKDGMGPWDTLKATFPAGTLSGAPKIRAMEIIAELEERPRGVYGGAVGYVLPRGDADFGIAIRTLVASNERFWIQAGAGIVADSDPRREAEETQHKAAGVMRAIRWATSPKAAY